MGILNLKVLPRSLQGLLIVNQMLTDFRKDVGGQSLDFSGVDPTL